jgi:hypothetical protein
VNLDEYTLHLVDPREIRRGDGVCLSLFKGGSTATTTQATTNNNQNIALQDDAMSASDGGVSAKDEATVAAGDIKQGSIEIGAGAHVESVDGEVISRALDSVDKLGDHSLDVLKEALGYAGNSQDSANQLARQTNELFAVELAKKSDDSDTEASATMQKNILIGTGILAVALVTSSALTKGKKR